MIDPAILFYSFFLAIIGLCFGSFATALIYRIPNNIPWIYNSKAVDNKTCRSACPSCGHILTARDLVPLLSWLFSKGKCRHCGTGISLRYPLVELATMSAVLLQFYAWGESPVTIPVLLSVPFLIAALVIDWDHMLMPDDTNIALTVLAAAFAALRIYSGQGGIADPLIAAAALTTILSLVSYILAKWKGRDALGLGDIKFLPAAGLFLGTAALPSFLAVSGGLGIVTAVIWQKLHEKQAFPFGPALIISLYIHVFLTGLGFDYKW